MVGDFIICLLAFLIYLFIFYFFYLKKEVSRKGSRRGSKKGGPEGRVHVLSTSEETDPLSKQQIPRILW